MDQRAGEPLLARDRRVAKLDAAGDKPKTYAVYCDDKDMVWITQWGANATMSFDPKTGRWTSYPGSADGANVRQILGRPGEIFLPESGLDRLMVVYTAGGK